MHVGLYTLCWDGVLAAAGCASLAAVATGSLHRVPAGTLNVQLKAPGKDAGQLLVGLPLLLQELVGMTNSYTTNLFTLSPSQHHFLSKGRGLGNQMVLLNVNKNTARAPVPCVMSSSGSPFAAESPPLGLEQRLHSAGVC